jgi:hypothetical protein
VKRLHLRWILVGLTFLSLGLTACSDEAVPPIRFGQFDSGSSNRTDGGVFMAADGGVIIRPGDPVSDGGMGMRPSREPVSIDTRLQYLVTRAGEPNQVSCDVLDVSGELIADARPSVGIEPDIRLSREIEGLVAEVAGEYRVWCVLPAFGLEDPTPIDWQVRPGSLVRVTAGLSRAMVSAGESVDVTCTAEDVFGNSVSIERADVTFIPEPETLVTRDGARFTISTAGTYEVSCGVDGVAEVIPAELTVTSGAAESLTLSLIPDQAIYRVGDILETAIELVDGYANALDAGPVDVTVTPQLERLGNRRYLLRTPGRFEITARYGGETVSGMPLVVSRNILVDEGGPSISCISPGYGVQVRAVPGSQLQLEGRVTDTAGVAAVTVDGRDVAINEDGHFSTNISVAWGLNVHEVVARDVAGEQSSTLCGFFASDVYQDPAVLLTDAVMVRVGQNAVDDGAGERPFDSLGDVLRTVLNSQGLVDFLDESAEAQNPVVPTECRVRVPLIGTCLFSAGILYRSLRISGPNSAQLRLVEGGIRVDLELSDVSVDVQLTGTLSNRGTLQTEFIRATAFFSVSLGANGEVRVNLTRLADVAVGDLDSDFEGFVTGSALEALIWLADTFFRDAIIDQVAGFLTGRVRTGMADFFNDLQLTGLTARFDVPSLGGGGGTALLFVNRLTRVEFTAEDALFGVGVRVDGDAVPGHLSLGVAVPPAALTMPESTRQASGVADLTLVNLILHRLWRSGYFESEAADLVSLFSAGFAGFRITVQMPVPPAAQGRLGNGRIQLSVGPILGQVTVPALGAEPLGYRATANVEADVELLPDNQVRFQNVDVSNLQVSVDGASIGTVEREGLDTLLTQVVQGIIDRTLVESIPSLPLPAFTTPAAFAPFGVPEGIVVGLRNGELSSDVRSWRALGAMGEIEMLQNVEPGAGICLETCRFSMDGECDDGGAESMFDVCDLGTDCSDCGVR